EGYSMTIDGTAYRGGAMFTLDGSGKMNLINIINIDDYVCGVLPSEIGGSSPLETIKAQAVAARSYAQVAASEGGSHSSMGFDVCPSTHCQVYRGIKSENENCNLAAKETAGLCLYYEGKPVQGYYAKNSGGYTQNVEDAWSNKLGYLRAVPDPYCPAYPWEKEYTFSELESKLANAGKSVGTLEKVEITKLADNGNVIEMTFTGSEGSVAYSKYNMRSFFGSSEVKSTMFRFDGATEYVEISKSGGTTVMNTKPQNTGSHDGVLAMKDLLLQNATGNIKKANTNEVFVVSGNGDVTKAYADKGEGLYVINAEGKKYLANATGSDESADDGSATGDTVKITTVTGKTVETSGTLHIYGLGYGHGIGLQQDGAIAMGKLGWSYEKILKYYYTDIEIR
ncbi:MAG: SpoIID/LytB domain-containing protein, partial [Firmicutes bacterium]|nr:SpoIID/LytB domain-containing protein [Bacillota bacterium]